MSVTRYRVVIKLDTLLFELDVGDSVKKSETLGCLEGRAVDVPFDAIVEDVYLSAVGTEEKTLVVTLIERQPISK